MVGLLLTQWSDMAHFLGVGWSTNAVEATHETMQTMHTGVIDSIVTSVSPAMIRGNWSVRVNPVTTRPKLVSTGIAARELGIDRVTLARWWRTGLVEPEFVTAGGHARWDMDKLRRDIKQINRRDR